MTQSNKAKHLPSKDYKHIGFIITQYSVIENLIEHIIWQLLKVDTHTGKILTSSASIQTRLDILGTLALIKFKEKLTIKETKEAIQLIRKLFDNRNYFAHGMWYYDQKTKTSWVVLTKENKANSNFKKKQYTEQNFKDFSQQLLSCSKYLNDFLLDIEKGAEKLR